MTFDEQGYPEPDAVYFQFKAAETLKKSRAGFVYDVDIRDYNLWMWEKTLVILVLFDATRSRAYWVHVRNYFREDPMRRPKKNAKTVRVRIPKHFVVNRWAIARIRDLKQEMQGPILGVQS